MGYGYMMYYLVNNGELLYGYIMIYIYIYIYRKMVAIYWLMNTIIMMLLLWQLG